MAKKQEEALQTTSENEVMAVSSEIPSFIQKGDLRGAENIAPEDARIPRLVLAQPQTPQVIKMKPEYIEGLTAGDSFNDLTQVIYGPGALDVIVVRADKPRWVEFAEDRGVVDPKVPYGDERTLFTTGEKGERIPPVATEFHDYVFLLGPELEPVAISFKGTAIRLTSQILNGLIKMKPVPTFACRYRLVPKAMQNDKGSWYVYGVKQVGFITSEEVYRRAEEAYETFKLKEVEFETTPRTAVDPDDDTLAAAAAGPQGSI